MKQKKLFIILGVWTLFSLSIPLLRDGLSRDSITRLLILAYFLLSLLWFYKKGQFLQIKNPKKSFILWCTINAMVMEICYMISRPLDMSLLITSNTSFLQGLQNTAVDLILTLPAYLLIFYVIWRLIKRYNYSPFAFFFLMGLGQALGDGNIFFLANPVLLAFIPYVMLNYWAMNFVPFLLVRNNLGNTSQQDSKWKKIILPIVLLPITYFVAGATILTLGKMLGWIPN